MKKTCLALALLLCCVSVVWIAGCADWRGTVVGTITYKDGSPAAGVRVGALDYTDDRAFLVWTDSAGRYVLEKVPPGGLEVVVWLSDATKVTGAVIVESDREVVLDITVPW